MNYFFILSSLFFQLFLKQADSDKVTWEKYSNENCKVSMEFPGKVEESMTEQEAAKTYKALYSTDKNVTYLDLVETAKFLIVVNNLTETQFYITMGNINAQTLWLKLQELDDDWVAFFPTLNHFEKKMLYHTAIPFL